MNAPALQQQPRTILLKTVKQPNLQYISFLSAPTTSTTGVVSASIVGQQNIMGQGSSSTVHHPIQNQTQAKMIQTQATKQFTTVSLKPQHQQQTIITTSKPSAATLKPNMVHLLPANFAAASSTASSAGAATQRVFQLGSATNSIKIHQPTSRPVASTSRGPAAASTSTSGSSSGPPVGGKPTSIWMLPKQQLIKVEGGSGSGSSAYGTTTIQLQATPKPLIHTATGYHGQHGSSAYSFGGSGGGSKFVPIAPYPQTQYYQGQQQQGQPMLHLKTEEHVHHHHASGNKITVVKIPMYVFSSFHLFI